MASVSVIVPVFNKAPFLAECLESILAQSLADLEVICVDDASTDGSTEILADYANRDRRVHVIPGSVNRGPGPSRNVGIAIATAPYVQFTDADDVLPAKSLETLYKRALHDGVPVIRGTVQGFSSEHDTLQVLSAVPDRTAFKPLDDPEVWLPWWHVSYLFSRDLLLQECIGYPRLRSGEDPVFLTSVLLRAPCMSTICDATYRYRIAPMEKKHRATYGSLLEYLQHARMVKQLLSGPFAECWTGGYGPLIAKDIDTLIERYPLSPVERRQLRVQAEFLNTEEHTSHRILFAYKLCGLGGVETSILNKAEALRKLGANVEALFLDFWGNGGKSIAERAGVHVLRQVDAQIDLLRKGWDAIVVVDSPEFVDTVIASGIDCALFFETHASYISALTYYYSRVNDPAIEAVIAPSDFNKRLLVAAGCSADRICVVPNALDPDTFESSLVQPAAALASLPLDRPIVLSVGRVEPQKNTLAFVQTALELLATGHVVHFVIVGDAVDTQEYAEQVRAAIPDGSGKYFTFIQELRHESMPELYRRAARSGGCLLVTSTNESQPMTLLEAMACECPVVAPDIGGIGEVVLDSVTGLLYPPGQADAAFAAVNQVLNSPIMRERIVRQARDLLTLDHSPVRTAEFYMSLTKKTRSARSPVPNAAALATEPPRPVASAVEPARAGAAPPVKHSGGQQIAARLDALVGEFVSLHMALLRERSASHERALATLFSEPVLDSSEISLKAYSGIAPGVHIGFEPSGAATFIIEPRRDFSHSPAHCLNTFTLRYSGKSRWFTLEIALDWEELHDVDRYQMGLYVRPDREAPGHVVLRLPGAAGGATDHRLVDFRLSPEERSCHCCGSLSLPEPADRDPKRRPKLIFFFDPTSDLALKFDYLTTYFA
jgi:glycosyltransferase involved in cell wall biosynthesis